MSVTRSPLTLWSITSAALHVPSSAWNRRVGSSKGVSTSSRDVSRSGSRNPCREHPAIHPARPRARAARACTRPRRWRGPGNNGSRRRAGAWDTGAKGRDERYSWDWFRQNEPVAIALMPSRRDHFPETLARLGHFCRKLSMSGQCGGSLTIRCEKQARTSPKRKGGRAAPVL